MKIQMLFIGVILCYTVLMNGCASKQERPASNTGFFKDYKSIQTQEKPVLKEYTKINLSPIIVISGIDVIQQSALQKKVYKEISTYLNTEYKKIISDAGYTLTDEKTKNTLVLESAISTVEVYLDDKEWNQLLPITMGIDVVSFNAYMNESVRLLGEMRLVDASSGKVISRNLSIVTEEKILILGDEIAFRDVKVGLDAWLQQVKENLKK